MSPRAIFVAGAHTDVGKTHAACGLLRAARADGLAVEVLKPVVSGFDAADWGDSDPGRLLAAAGVSATPAALEAISPWRFAAPLAPPMAARRERRELPLEPVTGFCRRRIAGSAANLLVLEGVGGLMSPIAEAATGLDLMTALSLPSLLVGGSYLGAISHILTALEVLRSRGLECRAVLVSESAAADAPDLGQTVAAVAEHAHGAPVIAAARSGDEAWARRLLAIVRAEP